MSGKIDYSGFYIYTLFVNNFIFLEFLVAAMAKEKLLST